MNTENLPERRNSNQIAKRERKDGFLAKVRAAKVNASTVSETPSSLAQKALETKPRLVFAFDATASRETAWEISKNITIAMFDAVPGSLEICLGVHGGSTVHTWTDFSTDFSKFRSAAEKVQCEAGATCLIDIMRRVLDYQQVKAMLYIGDVFEEDADTAFKLAESLRLRGVRVIIFQEGSHSSSHDVFEIIASKTRGALLPFNANSPDMLKGLLSAVALLAAHGVRALETKSRELPAAKLLLNCLSSQNSLS